MPEYIYTLEETLLDPSTIKAGDWVATDNSADLPVCLRPNTLYQVACDPDDQLMFVVCEHGKHYIRIRNPFYRPIFQDEIKEQKPEKTFNVARMFGDNQVTVEGMSKEDLKEFFVENFQTSVSREDIPADVLQGIVQGINQDLADDKKGKLEYPTDPVIEKVRADLLRRQQHGYKKYGTTLAGNGAIIKERLQHAYEEALDLANYLQWSIQCVAEHEASKGSADAGVQPQGFIQRSTVRRCQGAPVSDNGRCQACFAAPYELCLSPAAT